VKEGHGGFVARLVRAILGVAAGGWKNGLIEMQAVARTMNILTRLKRRYFITSAEVLQFHDRSS